MEALERRDGGDLALQGPLTHRRFYDGQDLDATLPSRSREPQPGHPLTDARHRQAAPSRRVSRSQVKRSARSWAYALTVFGEYPIATKCRRNASTGGMGNASESMTVNERSRRGRLGGAGPTPASMVSLPRGHPQSRCHPRAHYGATPYVAFVKDAMPRTLDK